MPRLGATDRLARTLLNADAQQAAWRDCVGLREAGPSSFRSARSAMAFSDGRRGLIGKPQHDDARVAAWRIALDGAPGTVRGDQNPVGGCGYSDHVGVGRTGQALADDG